MNTPASAIAWEICRKQRVVLSWIGLILLGSSVAACILRAPVFGGQTVLKPLADILVTVPLAILALIAMASDYGETGPRNPVHGFPSRLFHMPAAMATLVFVPMILSAALVLAAYFGWRLLVLRPLGVGFSTYGVLPCFLVAVFAWMQTIIWLTPYSPRIRLAIFGIGGLIPMFGYALIISAAVDERETLRWIWWYVDPGLVLLALAAFGTSVLCLNAQRHGRIMRLKWNFARWSGLRSIGAIPFRSGFAAQAWMDRRRFLVRALVMTVQWANPVFFLSLIHPNPVVTVATVLSWSLLIGAFLAAALCRPARGAAPGWNSFETVRPISTGRLLLARLHAGGLILLVSWAGLSFFSSLIVVPLIQWLMGGRVEAGVETAWAIETRQILMRPEVLFASLMLAFRGLLGGTAAASDASAARRRRKSVVAIAVFGLLVAAVGLYSLGFRYATEYLGLLIAGFIVMDGWAVVQTVRDWKAGSDQALLEPGEKVVFLVLFGVETAATGLMLWVFWKNQLPTIWILLALAAEFPVGTALRLPWRMHQLRHR